MIMLLANGSCCNCIVSSGPSCPTDLPHFPLEAGKPRFSCLHQLREHGTIDGVVNVSVWKGERDGDSLWEKKECDFKKL